MGKTKVRRRIFGFMMACAMAVAMLPATALAEGKSITADSNKLENGSYVLSSSVILTDGPLTVPSDVTVTLQLNAGATLTNSDNQHTILVENGGKLTITGSGTVDNKSNGKAAIFNNGTVVLNGGTYDRTSETGQSADISGNNSWYTICNHGDMTINNGVSVKNTGSFSSMIENGYYAYNSGSDSTGYVSGTNAANPKLTINGGTFDGGLNTVKNDDGGILTINGGSFSNTTQAAVLNWNITDISGGTFTVNKTGVSCILNGASASSASDNDRGQLTISGGVFTSLNGVDCVSDNFTNVDPTIYGGVFSSDVSTYCEDGYKTVQIGANYVAVTDTADPIAVVGDYGFSSVANAVAAAQNSDTVHLMKDASDFTLVIPEGITLTLDLGGHDLSLSGSTHVEDGAYANGGTAASLVNRGALTIQNGTIRGNASTANTIINVGYSSTLNLSADANVVTNAGQDTVVNLGGIVTTSAAIENMVEDCFTTYGGELHVEGGEIVAHEEFMSPIVVFNRSYDNNSAGAKVVVNAGSLKGDGYAISTNNLYSGGSNPSNVTINGGSLTSRVTSIYWPSSGTLTLGKDDGTGPNITSTSGSAVEVCSGTLNIQGGNYSGQGKTGPTDDDLASGYRQHSGSAGPGDAITIIAHRATGYTGASLNVSIAAGTFSSKTEYAVRYIDCNEAENADQLKQEVSISITGGSFAGAAQDIEATYVGNDAKKIVSGGYFTSDPSAYVAEGKAALTSNVSGYAFMVGDAPESAVVEPATGDPVVDGNSLPIGMSEENRDAAMRAAASVSDNGALSAAANSAMDDVSAKQAEAAKKSLVDSELASSIAEANVYVQTYLDIKPTAYDPANKTMTLDITPMYRVVASTAGSAAGINLTGETGTKNAVVLKGSESELDIQTMTLSVTLPSDFTDRSELYVNHVKDDGRSYFYTGAVASDVLTFTNPHGFSEFTISATNGAAAELNGIGYGELKDALADAGNGDIVTVLKRGLEATMSGQSRTVKLASGTQAAITVTINGKTVEIPASGTASFTYSAPSGGGTAPAPTTHDVTVAAAENGKVSVDPASAAEGEEVTVTVTPDEGYELASVSVRDSEGNEVELAANADGTYSFAMPAGGATVEASFRASLPFTDADGWYRGAVAYVYSRGLMTGYEGTTLFGPEDDLGREQAAAVLYRALGAGAQAPACGLADVDQADWYAQPVNWAVETGLIAGYDDGSGLFGVGDALTRDQFAAIIARVAKADLSKADPSALEAFSDGDEVAEWAVPAVSWAVEAGVLKGSDDGNGGMELRASAEITRGEMAAMIMRAAEAGLLPAA